MFSREKLLFGKHFIYFWGIHTMAKWIGILSIFLLAYLSPAKSMACTDHSPAPIADQSCTHGDHDQHTAHSCCEGSEASDAEPEHSACAGKNGCCCVAFMNHSCCMVQATSLNFNFQILLPKQEYMALNRNLVISGFSSIFIPPKIA